MTKPKSNASAQARRKQLSHSTLEPKTRSTPTSLSSFAKLYSSLTFPCPLTIHAHNFAAYDQCTQPKDCTCTSNDFYHHDSNNDKDSNDSDSKEEGGATTDPSNPPPSPSWITLHQQSCRFQQALIETGSIKTRTQRTNPPAVVEKDLFLSHTWSMTHSIAEFQFMVFVAIEEVEKEKKWIEKKKAIMEEKDRKEKRESEKVAREEKATKEAKMVMENMVARKKTVAEEAAMVEKAEKAAKEEKAVLEEKHRKQRKVEMLKEIKEKLDGMKEKMDKQDFFLTMVAGKVMNEVEEQAKELRVKIGGLNGCEIEAEEGDIWVEKNGASDSEARVLLKNMNREL